MLRATWYEGTAQLLSLTELKLHLVELYFIGWTIKPMKMCLKCVCCYLCIYVYLLHLTDDLFFWYCCYCPIRFFTNLFQCSSLLDASQYDDFVEEIAEDYEEIRDEHYENLKVRCGFSSSVPCVNGLVLCSVCLFHVSVARCRAVFVCSMCQWLGVVQCVFVCSMCQWLGLVQCLSFGWLLNIPVDGKRISGTHLLTHLDVLPHAQVADQRSNLLSHPVAVYWHRANQS